MSAVTLHLHLPVACVPVIPRHNHHNNQTDRQQPGVQEKFARLQNNHAIAPHKKINLGTHELLEGADGLDGDDDDVPGAYRQVVTGDGDVPERGGRLRVAELQDRGRRDHLAQGVQEAMGHYPEHGEAVAVQLRGQVNILREKSMWKKKLEQS